MWWSRFRAWHGLGVCSLVWDFREGEEGPMALGAVTMGLCLIGSPQNGAGCGEAERVRAWKRQSLLAGQLDPSNLWRSPGTIF